MKRIRWSLFFGRSNWMNFNLKRLRAVCLALPLFVMLLPNYGLRAQQEVTRKAKREVQPDVPVLARQLNLSGTVKVAIVVSSEGTVKNAHATGGHPLLVHPAEEAAKKWQFEPASEETTQVLEFLFKPRS